ncbi:flagellar basal body-associated FliL family protein [Szabonella alba]|uniref:Flagellar basal body-associated FliL family protein n=1 Tax=Szabonella alba TaxID=2804194 RepID=A0A8K0V8D0_9RHOB|nr:flagellar basal body-associated FliL family protein [Szabonella alba]MBL4917021.1 flagellar basal body-associated FliL family protein [Szabonella alba]
MGKILPLLLVILGLGAGAGAGMMLRPASEAVDAAAVPEPETPPPGLSDFVRLNNQFVIPVLEQGQIVSLVILSLSLEVVSGGTEAVYAREPRIRDALLQVLFDHANAGGFRGTFTDGANLMLLRRALHEAAQRVMGRDVLDVLIADIVRQDS